MPNGTPKAGPLVELVAHLSVWEITHRWCGAKPVPRPFARVPPEVKDVLAVLFTAILQRRLALYAFDMNKPPDDDPDYPMELNLYAYLDEFNKVAEGVAVPRRLLEKVHVERYELFEWCAAAGVEPPAFWGPANVAPDAERDGEEWMNRRVSAERPSAVAKREAQELARKEWKSAPGTNITEMSKRVRASGALDDYTESTVRKWIQPVAPDGVRNRRGRPKNAGPSGG